MNVMMTRIDAQPGTLPEQSPYLSDLRKKLQGLEYDLAMARQLDELLIGLQSQ